MLVIYSNFILLGVQKSARHHLSSYDHRREVGRLEAGQSVITVATVNRSVKKCYLAIKKSHRSWKYYVKERQWSWKDTHTSRRSICITSDEKNRKVTPSRIAADLAIVTSIHVSAKTISR